MSEKWNSRSLLRPALLLPVLLTLISFIIANSLKTGSGVPLHNIVRLNVTNTNHIQISENYIYFLENGSLHCVDSSGKYIWNLAVDSTSDFSASKYGIAVWNLKKLTMVDPLTGHLMVSKNMDGNILSAGVGDNYVAVVHGEENNSVVTIMNHYGTVIDNLNNLSGYMVLDFGFFEGRDLFWLMTLDSTGSVPSCRISSVIPNKRETGAIVDNEQIIYSVMFRSSYIAAVGSNYVRLYDYTGMEQTKQRITVYGWYMEAVDKRTDNPLMLFVPNKQVEDNYAISDVRMIRGNAEHIVHLPVACKQLEANGLDLYGFSTNHLTKCTFGEISPTVYNMPVTVDNVIGITTDKVAVVTSDRSIYLILLP